MITTAIIAPMLLATASSPHLKCNPLDGWEKVLAEPGIRQIVIGEMHGTEQMPAIFADIVCLTSQKRPIVVAVEQPAADQAAIDAYMASDGGLIAQQTFRTASMWNFEMKDGRSSRAYFHLFETLRRFRAAGKIRAVVAIVPSRLTVPFDQPKYEAAMAELLESASRPNTTVVTLVGNVHAMLRPVPWKPHYTPMAGNLPVSGLLSLNIVGEAGQMWTCTGRDASSCGPHSYGGNSGRIRRVELVPDAEGAFSGTIYLGESTTSSSPF